MKINIDNYEAFFLDFVEGRLDNSSTLEMLAFLRKHPHLKEELESFSEIKIPLQEEIFTDKDFLTKFDFTHTSINPGNFDDYCIAYHEKILTSSESDRLLTYLDKYPEKKNSFNLFGKTILKADPAVLFKGKSKLLHKSKNRVLYPVILRWTAVAAGVALLVSVFYFKDSENLSSNVVERAVVKNEHYKPAPILKNDVKEQINTRNVASFEDYTSEKPTEEQKVTTNKK